MKGGEEHVVPLTPAAVALLEGLPRFEGGDFILTTTAGRRPVSGFSKAKARLDELSGVTDYTIHDLWRTTRTGSVGHRRHPVLLRANPEQSDGAMVRLAKVDHKTVGAVRDKLVANGEIPDKAERTETNGRKARGRKPSTPKARAVPTPAAATPNPPASQARDKAVVEFARLLHSKPFETLDDLNRMLAGETGKAGG
jgi:hypothetical protein